MTWISGIKQFVPTQKNMQTTLSKAMLPHQKGRAATKEVVWTNSQAAPVKPNRKGDIQSELACTNMTHARWTKQVRRLRHYARAASSESTQMTLAEHKASLWLKIRQSTGFQEGFDTWWNQLDKVFPASPLSLPFSPPAADVALSIFEEFAYHYRALEKSMMKARHEHAKQRRTKDPMLIYRDLQRDRAEPVQTIVQNHTFAITSRHEAQDQVHITLQEPLPEGFQSVTISQIPVLISQTDQNEFAIPAETAAQLDSEITLRKNTGDITKFLDAFEAEWAPRRQKHDHTDHTKWDILTFSKLPCQLEKLDLPLSPPPPGVKQLIASAKELQLDRTEWQKQTSKPCQIQHFSSLRSTCTSHLATPILIHAVEKLVLEMQALRKFGRALHSMIVAIGLKALESTCAPEAPVVPEGIGIQQRPAVDGGIQHFAGLR